MSKEIEELEKLIEKDKELADRKKAVDEKSLSLREFRVDRDLNELIKTQDEIARSKEVQFGEMTNEAIEDLVKENEEYMNAAKYAMTFINKEFKKIVPFFRKNLILIGGDTGEGKSTTVSNIIFSAITSINPATGKPCRVLVLTNEEASSDFYNRVTCLVKGWKYVNHDQFSDEQRKTFNEYIPIWAKGGRLTVIDDFYQNVSGWTSSLEGIETIFENLLKNKDHYDIVILDYYQNVNKSKISPELANWQVQEKLSYLLDKMKKHYNAPIVVMAQMKRLVDEDDSTPYNIRLKGSKMICDKSTFICELMPERKLLRSKWVVWKSRFTEAVGQSIYTGYDRGKFIPYSIEFQRNIAKLVEKNLEKDKEEELGIIGSENKENND